MRKQPASGNDETRSVEPVSDWENRTVKGHAFCTENIFRGHIAKAQRLRDRHAAYLATLPADSDEAISQALKIMHPDSDRYPDGIEEALHLACALECLLGGGDVDSQGPTREAALYMADRIAFSMQRASIQLDRISDTLSNPGRLRQEHG